MHLICAFLEARQKKRGAPERATRVIARHGAAVTHVTAAMRAPPENASHARPASAASSRVPKEQAMRSNKIHQSREQCVKKILAIIVMTLTAFAAGSAAAAQSERGTLEEAKALVHKARA